MRVAIVMLAAVVFLSGCSQRLFRENASSAMSPTIQPRESVVADMAAFGQSGPRRWDVVVFRPPPKKTPAQPEDVWVMRVIGLPGEILEIRADGIYVGGTRATPPSHLSAIRYVASIAGAHQPSVTYPYTIPAETYFVLGDNTMDSFDSRFWGALPRTSILGRVHDK